MSTEEEGIREMLGKPCGRAGKSKQDLNRGAQTVKRHLQAQGRVIRTLTRLQFRCLVNDGRSWGLVFSPHQLSTYCPKTAKHCFCLIC